MAHKGLYACGDEPRVGGMRVEERGIGTAVVIAVVAVVVVGIIAAVLILNRGKENPVKPGYAKYSKFGFSFEYPENMYITERTGSTESWGQVVVSRLLEDNKFEQVSVGWMITEKPSLEVLKAVLENSYSAMEAGGATDIVRGTMVETTKAGHQMIYQDYSETHIIRLNGVGGIWYCDDKNRLYALDVTSTESDILSIYQRYLDSFVCH
jgi:hypothetical protein